MLSEGGLQLGSIERLEQGTQRIDGRRPAQPGAEHRVEPLAMHGDEDQDAAVGGGARQDGQHREQQQVGERVAPPLPAPRVRDPFQGGEQAGERHHGGSSIGDGRVNSAPAGAIPRPRSSPSPTPHGENRTALGMEQAAAFLETRRYAAYNGATTEFTKVEGVAHSNADKKLWIVSSTVRAGMPDGKNDVRPQDDIRLVGDAKDFNCGAVYESSLEGGQKDTDGQPIDSSWVAVDTFSPVHGARQPDGATTGKYDSCDTNLVANPDNLRRSEAMRTLFIGEDSGTHLNNFVWAYNPDAKSVTRIFSSPAGAENTGLNVFDDYNGHAYITANIQHPGAAEDLSKYPDAIKLGLRRQIYQRGYVGYLAGMPAVTH